MITLLLLLFALDGPDSRKFFKDTIVSGAVQRQVLDIRQTEWFTTGKILEQVLEEVQDLDEYYKNCPSIEYRLMFPSNQILDATLEQIDILRQDLEYKLWVVPYRRDFESVIGYLTRMKTAYNYIRQANMDTYYVPARRIWLKIYRDMVGTELFNRGWLPDIPWEALRIGDGR